MADVQDHLTTVEDFERLLKRFKGGLYRTFGGTSLFCRKPSAAIAKPASLNGAANVDSDAWLAAIRTPSQKMAVLSVVLTPSIASVATTGKYLHARPSDLSARYLGL